MPGDGRKLLRRILGIDAEFDGAAPVRRGRLLEGDRLAGCDPHLLGHEIDAEDFLGDRMLDLDACVHLDEEPAPAVEIVDEFDGAGAFVFDVADERVAASAICARTRGVQHRRRRLLDQLLVAALDAAIALPQMDRVAVAVAKHLNFDVAHPGKETLEVNLRIAEGRQRLRRGLRELRGELVRPGSDAHTAAAAAAGGFQQHRKADVVGDRRSRLRVGEALLRAGHHRHAIALGSAARLHLVAHHADRFGARADENEPFLAAGSGEGALFREKTVAGIDRVAAGAARRLDQAPSR